LIDLNLRIERYGGEDNVAKKVEEEEDKDKNENPEDSDK